MTVTLLRIELCILVKLLFELSLLILGMVTGRAVIYPRFVGVRRFFPESGRGGMEIITIPSCAISCLALVAKLSQVRRRHGWVHG